jgi:hypothetical protein
MLKLNYKFTSINKGSMCVYGHEQVSKVRQVKSSWIQKNQLFTFTFNLLAISTVAGLLLTLTQRTERNTKANVLCTFTP